VSYRYYRVTHIIVDDFETVKLYVVNFINRSLDIIGSLNITHSKLTYPAVPFLCDSYATCNIVQSHGLLAIAKLLVAFGMHTRYILGVLGPKADITYSLSKQIDSSF